jgi:hypothetical protein
MKCLVYWPDISSRLEANSSDPKKVLQSLTSCKYAAPIVYCHKSCVGIVVANEHEMTGTGLAAEQWFVPSIE